MVEPVEFLVNPGGEVGQYVITARAPIVALGEFAETTHHPRRAGGEFTELCEDAVCARLERAG